MNRIYEFRVIENREICFNNQDVVDRVCHSLLMQSNISLVDMTPVHVEGDGNCLYRAISRALYGSEEHHLEIRYRTLVELVINKDELTQKMCSLFSGNTPNWFHVCAPNSNNLSFEETIVQMIKDCATPTSFSTLIHIYGAAQALKIDIDQIYPSATRVSKDSMIAFLNETIECLDRNIHGSSRNI